MKILKSGCGCAPLAVDRLRRRFWMRLLRGYRAYRCRTCGRGFLARKALIDALLFAQRRPPLPSSSPACPACPVFPASRLAD